MYLTIWLQGALVTTRCLLLSTFDNIKYKTQSGTIEQKINYCRKGASCFAIAFHVRRTVAVEERELIVWYHVARTFSTSARFALSWGWDIGRKKATLGQHATCRWTYYISGLPKQTQVNCVPIDHTQDLRLQQPIRSAHLHRWRRAVSSEIWFISTFRPGDPVEWQMAGRFRDSSICCFDASGCKGQSEKGPPWRATLHRCGRLC